MDVQRDGSMTADGSDRGCFSWGSPYDDGMVVRQRRLVRQWADGHFGKERGAVIAIVSIRHYVAAMGCRAAIQSSYLSQHSDNDSPSQSDHSRVPARSH